MRMRDTGESFKITDIAGRITHALAKYRNRVGIDQLFNLSRIVAGGEAHGNAEARQHMAEQRMGGSIKLRHRHDIAAYIGQGEHGVMQGGLAGTKA